MKIIILSLYLLLFGYTEVLHADYNDGLTAYHEGDYKTALSEWKPLAEQGDADAQNNLGVLYNKGQGVTKDYEEAIKWYRKSANQGYVNAQYSLGSMYETARGVVRDDKKSFKWY